MSDYKVNLKNSANKRDLSPMLYGKAAPQATDLEGAILGALMLEPDKTIIIFNILKSPDCFYTDANQRVYASIRRLYDNGGRIDILTVTEELRKGSELEMVGGSYYVTGLTRDVVSAAHIEEHARIVLQKHILRELIRASGEAIGSAYEDTTDCFDLLDKLEGDLISLKSYITGGQHKSLQTIVGKYLEGLHAKVENEGKAKMYYRDVDKVLGPKQPGCMYIIAARPGMGKTSVLISSTLEESKHVPVGIWNGELTTTRFINRYICNIGNLNSQQIREFKEQGNLDEVSFLTTELLSSHNLFLDDTPSIDVDVLCAKIRYWVFICGVKDVWLDYINLIGVSEEKERYWNREQQLTYILKKLSEVSKQCNIPLTILAQLNRDVLKLADKKPNLGHLKEAGRIEEMVYHVGFLHRPEEYGIFEDEHGSTLGRMDYIVAKNSDGKNNVTIPLMTKSEYFKVYDQEEIELFFTTTEYKKDNTSPADILGDIPF